LFGGIFGGFFKGSAEQSQAVRRAVLTTVEPLERRVLLTTFMVTNTGDTIGAGSGSLRQAIIDANADVSSPTVIHFNIAASGVQTINVGGTGNGALPTLTRAVTIDGYSEGGASVNTLANGDNAAITIELNGANAGAAANGITLGAGSGGSTIDGLAVNRFSSNGILVQSDGNTVEGNFVGTNPTGTAAEPNQNDGIRIDGGKNNIIGGTTPDTRNVSSGNQIDGIHIVVNAGPATGNTIEGNFVGVNAAGTGSVGIKAIGAAAGTPAGNFVFGIEVSGGDSNTIGGTSAGARNVVGLNAAGIEVDDGGENNVIEGNNSGVGADGTTPVGNNLHGIVLRSDDNLPAPLGPGQTNEPAVSGNIIGLNPTDFSGVGNLIEFNGTAGIAVFGNPAQNNATQAQNSGNSILGNSDFENGRSNPTFLLGIDLTNQFVFPKDDGATPNDGGKNLAGTAAPHGDASNPNNFQNTPVITSVTLVAGGVQIAGTLTQSVTPNTMYRIEFFSNDSDPMGGVAEGQTFIGSTTVATDGTGTASFNANLTATVNASQTFTATATNLTADPSTPAGSVALYNTSEFSAAAAATTSNIVVTNTADSGLGSLRQAILTANLSPGIKTISFDIASSGVQTIAAGSGGNGALPTITAPVIIDGYSEGGATANTMANSDNAAITIELNGADAGLASGLTLGPGSGGSTIDGLAINRFGVDGILVQSNGNTITGNFVGTNPAGSGAEPNQGDGIRIDGGKNNVIGGLTPDARNVASGNQIDGIHIVVVSGPATGNTIEGNFVGVNAAGTGPVGTKAFGGATGTPAGNFIFGIEVSGGDNNTIGGAAAGARNVVGLNAAGIEVDDGGENNTIDGNYSGVGADGTTPVGNNLHGIVLRSDGSLAFPLGPAQANEPAVSGNIIGLNPVTFAGVGNLVEFNGTAGIAVFGNPPQNNATQAQNAGNSILGNSEFENGRSNPTFLLGIDLTNQFVFPKDDGATPNDGGKNVAGMAAPHGDASNPNNFQNTPVLTSVTATSSNVTIGGSLTQSVSPNTMYRIEFFQNDADPKGGIAEGQTFLGATTVTTDGSGHAAFSSSFSASQSANQSYTATATNLTADPSSPAGSANLYNTSEFSAAISVAPPNVTPVLIGVVPSPIVTGTLLKLKEKLSLTANSGSVNGSASATVLLSPDENPADSVLTLGSASGRLKLRAGQSRNFNLRLPRTIPSSVKAGTYHVLIQVTDTNGALSTIDSGQTLNIVAPAVDLTGSFVSASANAAGKFTATIFVVNSSLANVNASGVLPFDIDTSADGKLADAVMLKSGSRRINLAPGGGILIAITGTISSAGFLVVNLDPGNSAFPSDVNTANNSFATGSALTLG
jgi:hypothetical protein